MNARLSNGSLWLPVINLLILASLILTIAGCSTTESLLTSFNNPARDLDYFLGNEELKEPEPREDIEPDQQNEESLPGFSKAGLTAVELNEQEPTLAIATVGPNANDYPLETSCLAHPDPRFSYRKRIAFLALTVDDPQSAVDLQRIHQEYPRELLRQLNSDNFITIDATKDKLPTHNNGSPSLIENSVRRIAEHYNVQFVVTGSIENASFLANTSSTSSRLGNLLLGTPLKQRRQLQMRLSIYDGTSGTLIDEHFYQGSGIDQLSLRQKQNPLTTVSANGNSWAELINTYLMQQNYWLEETLTCLPMQARVLSVSGKGITFATGTEALLLPGDELKLMKRIRIRNTLSGSEQYRLEKNGYVTVSQVYPGGALAAFSGEPPAYKLNKGVIIKDW